MADFTELLARLQAEADRLSSELRQLNRAIQILRGTPNHGTSRRKRKLSAAARSRVAAAQRARWAKWKAKHTKAQ